MQINYLAFKPVLQILAELCNIYPMYGETAFNEGGNILALLLRQYAQPGFLKTITCYMIDQVNVNYPDAISQLSALSMMDLSPECIKIISGSGHVQYINRAGLNFVEAESAEGIIGALVYDFIAPEYVEQWRGNHIAVCAGEARTWDYKVTGLKGTVRHLETYAAPLVLPDGTTMQLAVTKDVTEQKGAEASAIESEFRFHTLAEEAPLWIWLTDKAGKVKYANKAMLAWLGFQQHTAISREVWSTFVHAADQHLLAQIVQQAYENKAAYNIECRVRSCHNQEYEWFAFTTVPRHINGLFDGFVGTASNIDMQKRSVEALEFRVQQRTRELHEANAALQRSNQQLAQFAHTISHDLKEPVRKVSIYSDMLRTDVRAGATGRVESHLEKIDRAVKRMNRLIDGVLSYSSLSADVYEPEQVNLHQALTEVMDDLEVALIAKQGVVYPQGSLPVITGAPVLLHQLLYNLIGNAIKFSRPGVPPEVIVNALRLSAAEMEARQLNLDKTWWVICVKDNGIGFNTEEAEKIFALYSRLRSRDEYEGTGLGLALCARIAARHGGSIEAEGVPGQGALFKVILPA